MQLAAHPLVAATTTPTRSSGSGRLRRGHRRVRERAGGEPRAPRRADPRRPGGGERRDRAGPGGREARRARARARACAARRHRARVGHRRRGPARGAPGDPQDRAPRLRRQGADALRRRGGGARRVAGARRRAGVLERRVALERELSVVLARGFDGASVVFPVAANVHEGGILATSTVPSGASPALEARVGELGRRAGRRHRSRRRARGRVLRRCRRSVVVQRDGPAPAQQRSLHARRLRGLAVRAAAARARRAAARPERAALPGGDAEPARGALGRERTGLERCARVPGGRCCTSTARPGRGRGARWGTSTAWPATRKWRSSASRRSIGGRCRARPDGTGAPAGRGPCYAPDRPPRRARPDETSHPPHRHGEDGKHLDPALPAPQPPPPRAWRLAVPRDRRTPEQQRPRRPRQGRARAGSPAARSRREGPGRARRLEGPLRRRALRGGAAVPALG